MGKVSKGRLGKVALVAASAALVVAACGGGGPPTGQKIANEGAIHVQQGSKIEYRQYPPASGPHYPTPLSYRFYDKEQPEGAWVHNLEHGGVVILYNCKGQPCTELQTQLDGLYGNIKLDKFNKQKLVITPNSRITARLAVIAWDWIDQFEQFDQARILAFFNNRVNHGPEDVP